MRGDSEVLVTLGLLNFCKLFIPLPYHAKKFHSAFTNNWCHHKGILPLAIELKMNMCNTIHDLNRSLPRVTIAHLVPASYLYGAVFMRTFISPLRAAATSASVRVVFLPLSPARLLPSADL